MPAWLEQLREDSAGVIERALASLVAIRNGHHGAGAAVVWDENGTLVTNAHVAGHGELQVRLPDGREARAQRLAVDRESDLAALHVDLGELTSIPRGDARRLRPGDWVYALGHPWGVRGAATGGIVIGTGADLPEIGERDGEWLVVGLHLRPGHSGGPLIDAAGRMVGLNTLMTGPDVGAAVPLHVVETFLREARIA